jgi:hypothetical protein
MYLRTVKVARSAINGRFVSKRTALRHRATTVVETYTIPTPGRRRAVARRRRRRPNRPW